MGFFNGFKKMTKSYDKVKMTEKVTYDQLLEYMKEGNYPLGEPKITGSGIMRAIRFDSTGKYQVMVALSGKTITISKIYADMKGMMKESIGDAVTKGMYSAVNQENIDGNVAVEEIGKEISRILQEKGLLA